MAQHCQVLRWHGPMEPDTWWEPVASTWEAQGRSGLVLAPPPGEQLTLNYATGRFAAFVKQEGRRQSSLHVQTPSRQQWSKMNRFPTVQYFAGNLIADPAYASPRPPLTKKSVNNCTAYQKVTQRP